MSLNEMIYKRKAFRNYKEKTVDSKTLQEIKAFIKTIKPLNPDIQVEYEIVKKDAVHSVLSWSSPQMISICSEKKEGYLENVGFMFQQLDLYLQSLGLGSCWVGMGKISQDNISWYHEHDMEFVILLAFGYPKNETWREDLSEFHRHSIEKISDNADERLQPARLAPSSVNSQPWYFTHDENVIHAHCTKPRLIKPLANMNRIDMGIALAHMYVANPETFQYFTADDIHSPKGFYYTGSFCI